LFYRESLQIAFVRQVTTFADFVNPGGKIVSHEPSLGIIGQAPTLPFM
jgi:hypothetical protein